MRDSIVKSVGSEQVEGACPEIGRHPNLNVLIAKENISTKSTKDTIEIDCEILRDFRLLRGRQVL